MERPFPWGLVVIAVLLGWGTFTLDDGWVRFGGLFAVIVVASALAYQIAQRDRERAEAARREAEDDHVDPWDDEAA